jgi:SAM-dependent methyltransferase
MPVNDTFIKQNISYYNEVADQYNDLLDRDAGNELMRKKVAAKFCETVPAGLVLDFGGGTGKDLRWLTEAGYRVLFLEPSSGMKEQAIALIRKSFSQKPISVVNDADCNFTEWHKKNPFPEKTDAILANFAVINCIPGIHKLFSNMALVIKPGGHLFALVLQSDFKKKFRANRLAAISSFFSKNPVTMNISFNNRIQTVMLYSSRQIKKAAAEWFTPAGQWQFNDSDFTLIQLTRK